MHYRHLWWKCSAWSLLFKGILVVHTFPGHVPIAGRKEHSRLSLLIFGKRTCPVYTREQRRVRGESSKEASRCQRTLFTIAALARMTLLRNSGSDGLPFSSQLCSARRPTKIETLKCLYCSARVGGGTPVEYFALREVKHSGLGYMFRMVLWKRK